VESSARFYKLAATLVRSGRVADPHPASGHLLQQGEGTRKLPGAFAGMTEIEQSPDPMIWMRSVA
jgi:hypothetical protein